MCVVLKRKTGACSECCTVLCNCFSYFSYRTNCELRSPDGVCWVCYIMNMLRSISRYVYHNIYIVLIRPNALLAVGVCLGWGGLWWGRMGCVILTTLFIFNFNLVNPKKSFRKGLQAILPFNIVFNHSRNRGRREDIRYIRYGRWGRHHITYSAYQHRCICQYIVITPSRWQG